MSNHLVSDALFMAQVWQTIKRDGYDFVIENGDPDGIDFVANRIIEEAAQHHEEPTPSRKAGSDFPYLLSQQLRDRK